MAFTMSVTCRQWGKDSILGEKGLYFELALVCRQGVDGTSICLGTYWMQMIDSFTLSLIFEAENYARFLPIIFSFEYL